MRLNIPALRKRILTMSNDELEQLAKSEALVMADSSRLESLPLDQDRIRSELLAGYLRIRYKSKPTA